MKTKSQLKLVTFVVMLLFSFASRAQTYCTNNLNCDVTIFCEMYELDSFSNCVPVCSTGLTIPANSTMLLPDCTSSGLPCDICIIITDIGGCAPPDNHSSNNVGHVMTPYGQSGFSTCCDPAGVNWTASQTPGSWVIQ